MTVSPAGDDVTVAGTSAGVVTRGMLQQVLGGGKPRGTIAHRRGLVASALDSSGEDT